MQNLISNELLSDVLDKEITEFSIHTGFIWFRYKDYSSNINTYELAFKMKQWAKNKGYTIISGYDNDYMGEKYNKRVFGYCCQIQDKEFNIKDFYSDSEVNAITESCQYILEKVIKEG